MGTLLLSCLLALVLLTGGSELLVRGSVAIARRLGVSTFFIGLTIVGFGTSTPELATSLLAALRGQGDIAVANVIGSNLFNTGVILGLTALICPIPVQVAAVRRESLVAFGATLLPYLALLSGGVLLRWEGAAMLACLGLHLARGWRGAKREGAREREAEAELERETGAPEGARHPLLALGSIVLGLVLLLAGARVLVDAASDIARSFGISERVIGLTLVAAGTSLPELATSVIAALRRQPDIAIGNVLGSNVFNLLGILGTTCVARPQAMGASVLRLDLPALLVLGLLVIPMARSGARLSRGEGLVLLAGYAAYLALVRWSAA